MKTRIMHGLDVPACLTLAGQTAGAFEAQEATVASVLEAIAEGRSTCRDVVRAHLDRIEAYDRKGPALRALITVNDRAMDEAARLDALYAADRGRAGRLHCVPVILKDNFDTADMPTTGGNLSMKTSQPRRDAFTVVRMRSEGAIIIAKANLQEFARGGVSVSSLGGQVLNPYDLTRTPGGSSGGTGAAIAASFGVLGTGSDTGQSIRSPASATSLVGVRPTRGLVSRAGVIPNSSTQDEIGPITRTVTDAALLLDVMAGFDTADPITALGVGKAPRSYADGLRVDALKGARIGLVTNLLGREERHAEVTESMNRAADEMRRLGATVVPVSFADLGPLTRAVATSEWEARWVMDAYFATLGPDAPVRSFRQLVDARTASPDIQKTLEREIAIESGTAAEEYRTRTLNREKLRIAIAARMAEAGLDAILYPLQSVLVVKTGETDQPERNGVLSNGTGFPAVTFPAGFSKPGPDAPVGVPIGAELLGLDYTEPRLLAYAYAFEQAVKVRRPPRLAPTQ